MAQARPSPSWDQLYEIAASQDGLFTTRQAAEAGYSPQLITKYLRSAKMVRVRRGIYRLVHFPPGEREDLVMVWLWTEQKGVFSHETALALHGLSDVLPVAPACMSRYPSIGCIAAFGSRRASFFIMRR